MFFFFLISSANTFFPHGEHSSEACFGDITSIQNIQSPNPGFQYTTSKNYFLSPEPCLANITDSNNIQSPEACLRDITSRNNIHLLTPTETPKSSFSFSSDLLLFSDVTHEQKILDLGRICNDDHYASNHSQSPAMQRTPQGDSLFFESFNFHFDFENSNSSQGERPPTPVFSPLADYSPETAQIRRVVNLVVNEKLNDDPNLINKMKSFSMLSPDAGHSNGDNTLGRPSLSSSSSKETICGEPNESFHTALNFSQFDYLPNSHCSEGSNPECLPHEIGDSNSKNSLSNHRFQNFVQDFRSQLNAMCIINKDECQDAGTIDNVEGRNDSEDFEHPKTFQKETKEKMNRRRSSRKFTLQEFTAAFDHHTTEKSPQTTLGKLSVLYDHDDEISSQQVGQPLFLGGGGNGSESDKENICCSDHDNGKRIHLAKDLFATESLSLEKQSDGSENFNSKSVTKKMRPGRKSGFCGLKVKKGETMLKYNIAETAEPGTGTEHITDTSQDCTLSPVVEESLANRSEGIDSLHQHQNAPAIDGGCANSDFSNPSGRVISLCSYDIDEDNGDFNDASSLVHSASNCDIIEESTWANSHSHQDLGDGPDTDTVPVRSLRTRKNRESWGKLAPRRSSRRKSQDVCHSNEEIQLEVIEIDADIDASDACSDAVKHIYLKKTCSPIQPRDLKTIKEVPYRGANFGTQDLVRRLAFYDHYRPPAWKKRNRTRRANKFFNDKTVTFTPVSDEEFLLMFRALELDLDEV